ncbi:MAG: hypothetical protein IH945_00530 [Armatimonadetes bacterium]|nr:hypothetical protein [Armatimonadota bacterium]
MGTNRLLPWSILTALLLSATACSPPPSRIIGTWKNDWAIERGEMTDKGGLVLSADGTMEHSVYLPDGSSQQSKGTYQYADEFLVVTETESFSTDTSGVRKALPPRVWGGPVTFFSSNEIKINDPEYGPITLVRHK